MPTILIIDDQAVDRELLSAVLQSAGYTILEATDGDDALTRVRQARPDLVISDILLPSVDGYELVRRLREDQAIGSTPVIFYPAAYHEREARALAARCGVSAVLPKPSAPQAILDTVAAALASGDHRRLVGAATERFDAEVLRMEAVAEAMHVIASKRDPESLLRTACAEARRITLAQQAFMGLLDESDGAAAALFLTASEPIASGDMTLPDVNQSVLQSVVRDRQPLRIRNPGARPEALGLPADHPPVTSLLSVPVASSRKVHGWLSLRNKLGTDEFTEADERAAVRLGTHTAIAYENACALRALEMRDRRVREEERARLSRALHDQVGQSLSVLQFELDSLQRELASTPVAQNEAVMTRVDELLGELRSTIEMVRAVATELRPPLVDQLGLVAALESEAEAFERRSGIRCRFTTTARELALDPRQSAAIVQIAQEALTNVGRHARATRVVVSVRATATLLTVSVTDNGVGIAGSVASFSSLGLIGMRERAAMVGATLDVRRRKPRGTIVSVRVPLGRMTHLEAVTP